MSKIKLSLSILALCAAMNQVQAQPKTFAQDVSFLQKYVPTIVLRSGNSAVALVPGWQGRVATSTFDAKSGAGNGWLNYEHIASRKIVPHINVFGGEDRFWIGPEGGQFSVFFKSGDPFDLAHWQTPALIDTDPFTVTSKTATSAIFEKDGILKNYWGTQFNLHIRREVVMNSKASVEAFVGGALGAGVKFVAYETRNTVKNTGDLAWSLDTGLISIWILGMLKHSPTTTVICPFNPGPESKMGPIVNDTYFGKVPANRLKIGKNAVYFKADGQMRTKIGLNPHRSTTACGSYDPVRNLLTIVQYSKKNGETKFVNSMWEMQDNPYGGDVVNSYNDGPPAPGKKPLGPFYELETSSHALALAPGQSRTHLSRTMHFSGTRAELQKIATNVLGVSLDDVVKAF